MGIVLDDACEEGTAPVVSGVCTQVPKSRLKGQPRAHLWNVLCEEQPSVCSPLIMVTKMARASFSSQSFPSLNVMLTTPFVLNVDWLVSAGGDLKTQDCLKKETLWVEKI